MTTSNSGCCCCCFAAEEAKKVSPQTICAEVAKESEGEKGRQIVELTPTIMEDTPPLLPSSSTPLCVVP